MKKLLAIILTIGILLLAGCSTPDSSGNSSPSGSDIPDSSWHAFINFQGKHYNLGTHPTFQSAVKARRAAEERLHDPAIIAHIETLTEERRKEFAMYLRDNGGTI